MKTAVIYFFIPRDPDEPDGSGNWSFRFPAFPEIKDRHYDGRAKDDLQLAAQDALFKYLREYMPELEREYSVKNGESVGYIGIILSTMAL